MKLKSKSLPIGQCATKDNRKNAEYYVVEAIRKMWTDKTVPQKNQGQAMLKVSSISDLKRLTAPKILNSLFNFLPRVSHLVGLGNIKDPRDEVGLRQFWAKTTKKLEIGSLQDPVTWYGIYYTGTQMTQNKETRTSPARLPFVFKVPLRHLRPSIIYSVPCDWFLQRADCLAYMQDLL